MEPLILFIIILVVSSFLKKRGQQRKPAPEQEKSLLEPVLVEGERDPLLEFAQNTRQEERKEARSLPDVEQKDISQHFSQEERAAKRKKHPQRDQLSKRSSAPTISSDSLFSAPGSLQRGIIMMEILGPPRAKKPGRR